MSVLKKLAGETIIYGIGAILPRIVSLLLIGSYLTFRMDTENYGIYSILYGFIAFAMVMFTLRMESTFFKFGVDKNYDRKYIFNSTLSLVFISATLFLVLLLLFNKPISAFLAKPEQFRFVIYFSFILFLDAISSVPFAKLRLDTRPKKFAFIKIANSLITAVVILFCFEVLPYISSLSAWYNPDYFIDYAFIANLIGSAFIVLMLYSEFSGFKWTWNKELVTKMWRYAWPLIIVGMAGTINQFSDRIFIAYLTMSGEETKNLDNAGMFSGAIKIAVVMNLFITAFNYAAEPFFFNNSTKDSKRESYGSVALAFTIGASAIFMMVVFYIDIFKLMIEKSYHEALYVVPIALLAYLFLGLYYNFSIWYRLSGKTIYGAIIAISGSVLVILLNILLIPKIGMIGANYASLACFILMCVLAYLLGQKYYPISYPIGKMAMYLGISIVCVVIFSVLEITGMKSFIYGAFVLIGYFGFAYYMDLRRLLKR